MVYADSEHTRCAPDRVWRSCCLALVAAGCAVHRRGAHAVPGRPTGDRRARASGIADLRRRRLRHHPRAAPSRRRGMHRLPAPLHWHPGRAGPGLRRLDLRGVPYRTAAATPAVSTAAASCSRCSRGTASPCPATCGGSTRWATESTTDEVRPGDLLFFDTGSDGASHVGIALDAKSSSTPRTRTAWCGSSASRPTGRAATSARAASNSPQFCPLNASHDTLGCQLTNVPVGFSFHAHTCSV